MANPNINYCTSCNKFPNILSPICPVCGYMLVGTYHLQKGDKVYTNGACLEWTGKQYDFLDSDAAIYFGDKVVLIVDDKPFIVL